MEFRPGLVGMEIHKAPMGHLKSKSAIPGPEFRALRVEMNTATNLLETL